MAKKLSYVQIVILEQFYFWKEGYTLVQFWHLAIFFLIYKSPKCYIVLWLVSQLACHVCCLDIVFRFFSTKMFQSSEMLWQALLLKTI